MEKSDSVTIIESEKNAVVKNYASVLKNNGFTNVKVISYSDYTDLQEKLWSDMNFDGYVLLDPTFSHEAISFAPFMFKKNYAPLFLTKENKDSVLSFAKDSKLILAGHFPVRMIDDISASKEYTSWSFDNANAITRKLFTDYDYSWGTMTKDNLIDMSSIKSGNPIFFYRGYLDEAAQLVKDSNIDNYEVIGADMADVSKNIESQAGRNVHLILKYAQTITNFKGLEGRLMNLKRVQVPVLVVNLELLRTVFYTDMNTLSIAIRNNGNVPTYFFSNIEFGDEVLSDEFLHQVLPGENITIPYIVNATGDTSQVFVSAAYGVERPLRHNLLSDTGLPVVVKNITPVRGVDESNVELEKATFNDKEGYFYVYLNNPNDKDIFALAEVIIDDDNVLSSKKVLIPAHGSMKVRVDASYVPINSVIDNSYNIHVYFGKDDLLKKNIFENIFIEEESSNLWIYIIVVIIATLIVITIISLIIGKKRKKEKEERGSP